MVDGAFSGSFEVVVVPLGGRVACLMKLIGYKLIGHKQLISWHSVICNPREEDFLSMGKLYCLSFAYATLPQFEVESV